MRRWFYVITSGMLAAVFVMGGCGAAQDPAGISAGSSTDAKSMKSVHASSTDSRQALSASSAETLTASSSCSASSTGGSEKDPSAVRDPSAVYDPVSGQSANPAAVSDLQLVCETTFNGVWDGDVTWVDASYQQLSFDETDYSGPLTGTDDLSSEAKSLLSRAADTLNRDVAAKADSAVEDLRVMAQSEDEEPAPEGSDPYYHNYEKLYVQRADASVLSVLSLTDVYSHGAHGSVILRGCNYDPATGNELKIDDVFTDKNALPDIIAFALTDQYPDLILFSATDSRDTASLIREIMNNTDSYGGLQFTLDPKGVTFWFSAGDITAYASGAQTPSVRYADLSGIIDPSFVPETDDSYAVAVPEYVPMTITDDSGRGFSSFQVESDPATTEEGYDAGARNITISVNGQSRTFELPGHYAPDYYLITRGERRFLLINTHQEDDWETVHLYELPSASSDGVAPHMVWTPDDTDSVNDTGSTNHESSTYPSSTDTAAHDSSDDGGMTAEYSCGLYYHVLLNPDRFFLSTRSQLLGTTVCANLFRLDDDGNPVAGSAWYTAAPVSENDIVLRETRTLDTASDRSGSPENLTFRQAEIPGGTVLQYYRTNMTDSVDFLTPDNRIVRIRVDNSGAYPQTVNGIDAENMFTGIAYSG